MIRSTLAGVALALGLSGAALADPVSQDPSKAPAGDYVLDKRHASLIAKIPHLGGFSKFTMRFDRLEGSFTFDPPNWRSVQATITVDPASVDTGLADFDKTLAGPSYFNAAKYPAITFVARQSDGGPDGRGTIIGDLTFMGVTKPVTLDVTFNGFGPGLLGAGTRMGFSGVGRIKRSDFGLTTMSLFAGDTVDLIFDVEFTRK
jgi:polyisoprenoid-binding protein YceI